MSKTLAQLKTKALKDPAVKAEYEALAPEYAIIKSIIKARQERGITQTELAKRVGTRQPVISRLERGEGNPTILQLQKIAAALDKKITISLG